MITIDKNGGRTIHLFLPFDYKGKKVESITIAPLRFGHTLRWGKGDWKDALSFLVELAGVDEAVIRELRYPDADRVMESFLAMLPVEIRTDISEGRIPRPAEEPLPEEQPEPEPQPVATNGSGGPMYGPGAPPPPDAGFDMSDEPPPPEVP